MAKLANPKLAVTSMDWKRSTGGSLAPSYATSFGGLTEFYDNQRLPTQQQHLQKRAHDEQDAAGGFYRPGFEPRMNPPANILPPAPRSMTPPPPATLINHGGGFYERPNPYGTATAQRALTKPAPTVSATPPPYLPPAPPAAPPAATQTAAEAPPPRQDNRIFAAPQDVDFSAAPLPTFGTGGARSANDPARMMETLARNNRRNPRAQGIAAGFFQEQDNIRYNREQDAAQLDAYQTRTNAMEEARNAAANARVQERKDRETAAAEQVRRQQEKDAIDLNFKLAEESRRAAEFAKTMVPAAPDMTVLPIPGTNNVYFPQGKTVLSSNTPPTPGMMEIAPGSGQYLPTFGGKPQPSLGTFTQESPALPDMPLPRNVPLGPFGNLPLPAMTLPGKPATFKPLNTNKPEAPKKINRGAILKEIQSAESILADANATPRARAAAERVLTLAEMDLNGDGVVSDAERQQSGAGAGASPPPAQIPRARIAPPIALPSGNRASKIED